MIKKLFQFFKSSNHDKNSCGIYAVEQFREMIACERARSNRNGHRFSLLVLHVDRFESDGIEISRLIETLTNRIRVIDIAGWLSEKSIGIFLPFTASEGALRLADSLYLSLREKNSRMPDYTVYTYPEDGHTDGDNDGRQLHFGDISPEWNNVRKQSLKALTHNSEEVEQQTSRSKSTELIFLNQNKVWKRTMDVMGALFGLVASLPIFLVVGSFIKIVSPGPVFFKQVRVGYMGKKFTMWKFRTMQHGTKATRHQSYIGELVRSNQPMHKVDSELPIIPLGKLFRDTCLDELPQLFNVLFGDMSLVGPRPPIPYEVKKYLRWHNERFAAVPGMTGLWQVSGKNELTFNQMMRLDIRYAQKISPRLDVKILLLTPLAIVSQIKANPFIVRAHKRGVVKND